MKKATCLAALFCTALVAYSQSPGTAPVEMGEYLGNRTVTLEGGTFSMGSYLEEDEHPPHRVTVGDFSIGRYEVTVTEYEEYCISTGRDVPS